MCADPTAGSALRCRLAASTESPIYNIPLVVENWGGSGATLKLNGRTVRQGRDFRVGHRYRLKDTDLVVWIRLQSAELVGLELAPINAAP